jgi:acyl carrier protein
MDIEKKVLELTQDLVHNDNLVVTKDLRFVEDLGYDSLDIVELLISAEILFKVDLDDDVCFKEIKKVEELIQYIKEVVNGPSQ